MHINTIPMENLEGVKDWLDSVDIPFSEGPLNLSWGAIMKTVTSDPYGFFQDGGWLFLGGDSDSEGEDEEEESAFEVSDSEIAADESSEEESGYDDDDASDENEAASEDESDEGADWDELEKEAIRKDKEAARGGHDDGDKPRKRKR